MIYYEPPLPYYETHNRVIMYYECTMRVSTHYDIYYETHSAAVLCEKTCGTHITGKAPRCPERECEQPHMRRVAQLITYTRLACGSDACILGLTLLLSSPHLFPCLFPFHVALVGAHEGLPHV